MQLEIKLVIDFGDRPIDTDRLGMAADKAIQNAMGSGAFTAGCEEVEIESWNTSMGWTLSGDDKPEGEDTYEVVKFYKDPNKEPFVLLTGLSLAHAKEEVNGPGTSTPEWFLGFRKE